MTAFGRMNCGVRLTLRVLVAACVLLSSCSGATAKPPGTPTCVSHAGYPDFAIQGKPPAKNLGLPFCQKYDRNTCCDRGTTDSVRRVVAHMQQNGFSSRCRDVSVYPFRGKLSRTQNIPNLPSRSIDTDLSNLIDSSQNLQAWTSLECSVCDPHAGVVVTTPVCQNTCDSVYLKCAGEHFAEDALGRVVPCRASDTICAKLSDWMAGESPNSETEKSTDSQGQSTLGTQMCVAAGYSVVRAAEGGWCFDENDTTSGSGTTTTSTAKSSKSSNKKSDKKSKKKGAAAEAEEFKKLQHWMGRIYAVAGIGAVVRVLWKIWDRKRRDEKGTGAARVAAKLAVEHRNRKSAFEKQAKML